MSMVEKQTLNFNNLPDDIKSIIFEINKYRERKFKKFLVGCAKGEHVLTVTIPQIIYSDRFTPKFFGITQYNGGPIDFKVKLLTEYGPIEGDDDGNTFDIYHLTPVNPVMAQVHDDPTTSEEEEEVAGVRNKRKIFGQPERPVLLYVNTDTDIYILLPFDRILVLLRATYDGKNLTFYQGQTAGRAIALNIYEPLLPPNPIPTADQSFIPSVDPTPVPYIITQFVRYGFGRQEYQLDLLLHHILLMKAAELGIDTMTMIDMDIETANELLKTKINERIKVKKEGDFHSKRRLLGGYKKRRKRTKKKHRKRTKRKLNKRTKRKSKK